MHQNYKKNIIAVIVFILVMAGFVAILGIFFDVPLLSIISSQLVSVQASVVALVVFVVINFLFITNFLHTSHTQYSAILENIAEGLVIMDKHTKIRMINDAASRMLSISFEDAIGKRWDDIARIESHQESVLVDTKPLIDSLSMDQKIYSKEWQIRGRAGDSFPAAISISPIVSRKRMVGSIVVFRNIEKEKEIDNAKNEFISLVSHQLRTPLSAVNWCTESLLAGDMGKLNKKQQGYIARVSDSNKRMITLVNSILDVSQIELNTFIVDARPSDIYALLEDVVNESAHMIETKKLVIHKNYNQSLGIINIDTRYVRMIIDNLLSNAIKYTPEHGSISITVAREGTNLSITVSDTGYGIPAHDSSKIFTKLFRAHNVMTKDTDGNGLGLYIIKSIVSYAGGKIWFESVENKGTTFFVVLPIHAPVSPSLSPAIK